MYTVYILIFQKINMDKHPSRISPCPYTCNKSQIKEATHMCFYCRRDKYHGIGRGKSCTHKREDNCHPCLSSYQNYGCDDDCCGSCCNPCSCSHSKCPPILPVPPEPICPPCPPPPTPVNRLCCEYVNGNGCRTTRCVPQGTPCPNVPGFT